MSKGDQIITRKVLNTQEVMMLLFEFKLWLEDKETYDKRFKPRANLAASRLEAKGGHPFAHWFPKGQQRLYLPLQTPEIPAASHYLQSPDYYSPADKEVIRGLEDLGYKIHDYKQGYVKRGGHGIEKIGGLLQKLMQFAKSEEDKTEYKRWYTTFVDSPARRHNSPQAQNLFIIISRNQHDIAQMSYDRSWTSCMELEDGAYKHVPFCVIRTGGMVAYLVNQSEAEVQELVANSEYIDNPIARMSIKAAYNTQNKRQIIAIPETSVYPQNVKGFWETVADWVEEHQKNVGSGNYRVLGGYSDEYTQRTDTGYYNKPHMRAPRGTEALYRWLTSPIVSRQREAMKYVLDSRQKFPKEIYMRIKDIALDAASYHNGYSSEDNGKVLYLYKKHPEIFTQQDIEKMSYYAKAKSELLHKNDLMIDSFVDRFREIVKKDKPNLFGPDDLNKIRRILDSVASGQAQFDDSYSFSRMVSLLETLTNWLYNVNHYNPRDGSTTSKILLGAKDHLQNAANHLADTLLTFLDKVDFDKMAKKRHRDFASAIADLFGVVLRHIDMEENFDKVARVVEKTLNHSDGRYNKFNFDGRYSWDTVAERYKDNPQMLEKLKKLRAYIQATPDRYDNRHLPHPYPKEQIA